MELLSWLHAPRAARRERTRCPTPRTSRYRPLVETLEDRLTPSHFRYSSLTWEPTTGNEVLFHMQQAYRRSYFGTPTPNVGSVVQDGISVNFGDGALGPASLRVLSVNAAEDFFVAEVVRDVGGGVYAEGVLHTYAGPGPFLAFFTSSARISSSRNNAGGTYRVETDVTPGTGNRPPVSNLPPLVQIVDNQLNTFQIPATDPNGDPLTFRLSTSQEASGSSTGFTQPPGLTMSSSGVLTWDVRDGVVTTAAGDLWSVQIMASDSNGARVPLDFLLQVVSTFNNAPPDIDVHPAGPITAGPGTALRFNVGGHDRDPGDTIVLQALNPPAGMTFTQIPAPVGSRAQRVTLQASFTPTAAQLGSVFVLNFQATDRGRLTDMVAVTVRVVAGGGTAPPVAAADAYSVQAGTVLRVAAPGVLGNDTDPQALFLTATLDAGPTSGTLALNPDGSFTYTPAAGFIGTDTFTYRAGNGSVASAVTTVTIAVVPPAAPIGFTGTISLDPDATVNLLSRGVDAGETGRTVFLDLDGNGQLSAGEPSATTDADGAYRFTNLPAGTYTIRQVFPPWFVAVAPPGELRTVTLGVGGPVVVTGVANLYGPPPIPDASTAFIHGLYRTILRRDGEPEGVRFHVGLLTAGKTRTEVSASMWQSLEHRRLQVADLYRNFLRREPEEAGLAFWLDVFQGGTDEATVAEAILSSAEYTRLHPTDADLASALYTDLLGRAGDVEGLRSCEALLASGVPRAQVAASIFRSPEAVNAVVSSLYVGYLWRPGEEAGKAFWRDVLDDARRLSEVVWGFLASEEFFANARAQTA